MYTFLKTTEYLKYGCKIDCILRIQSEIFIVQPASRMKEFFKFPNAASNCSYTVAIDTRQSGLCLSTIFCQ